MSHWAVFKRTTVNLWMAVRHDIAALAVLLNGLLIFKTIYGMSVNLLDIFHIHA
ncbi:MAG: voltage-gated potassium channel protein, partial [Plesiomonas shigelloides]